jgi:HAD superfamily hydrolase (TIGR01509 family)
MTTLNPAGRGATTRVVRAVRALIFDFDGLMVDTELPAYQLWQEVYQAHDCELTLDEWAVCIGGEAVPFDPLANLEARLGRTVDREAIHAQRLRRRAELFGGLVALPGVERYLRAARRLGLKVGLASSSSREWVGDHLRRLGLDHFFDAIRTADDVERIKPDPALYLAVLAALDVRADEALVLEDSPNGIRAANRAGIFCVAIPNALTGRLSLEHADMRLTSLADVPLELLIARVTGRG